MIESAGLSHSAYLSISDCDYPVSKGLFHEMSIWNVTCQKPGNKSSQQKFWEMYILYIYMIFVAQYFLYASLRTCNFMAQLLINWWFATWWLGFPVWSPSWLLDVIWGSPRFQSPKSPGPKPPSYHEFYSLRTYNPTIIQTSDPIRIDWWVQQKSSNPQKS